MQLRRNPHLEGCEGIYLTLNGISIFFEEITLKF